MGWRGVGVTVGTYLPGVVAQCKPAAWDLCAVVATCSRERACVCARSARYTRPRRGDTVVKRHARALRGEYRVVARTYLARARSRRLPMCVRGSRSLNETWMHYRYVLPDPASPLCCAYMCARARYSCEQRACVRVCCAPCGTARALCATQCARGGQPWAVYNVSEDVGM